MGVAGQEQLPLGRIPALLAPLLGCGRKCKIVEVCRDFILYETEDTLVLGVTTAAVHGLGPRECQLRLFCMLSPG